MENNILSNMPFDISYVIIALPVLLIILIIVVTICVIKLNKLYRRYDVFMRGKNAETLEYFILEQQDRIEHLETQDKNNKSLIKLLNKSVLDSYQKFGLVKYNAFKGMGGTLSFAMTLLNKNNTGFIINTVHSKEGCYIYIKDVVKGEADIMLSEEEKTSLTEALSE
jgi:hypothetical protein